MERDINDVRKSYKTAKAAQVQSGNIVTIFEVKGNNYRLIVAIHCDAQRVYVRDFMTRAEYNNQLWKRRH